MTLLYIVLNLSKIRLNQLGMQNIFIIMQIDK